MSKIEITIIAYFDGRLSDAEGAELLQRISTDTELRTLFREHQTLRKIAQRASLNAHIRPEVEDRLFAHIETLANGSRKRVFPHGRIVAGLALLLVCSTAGYMGYNLSHGVANNLAAHSEPATLANTGIGNKPLAQANNVPQFSNSIGETSQHTDLNKIVTEVVDNPITHSIISVSRFGSAEQVPANSDTTKIDAPTSSGNNSEQILPSILPVSIRPIASVQRSIGEPVQKTFYISDNLSQLKTDRVIELGLQTSSGFSYPAQTNNIQPFADFRLSGAYIFSINNLIGIRLSSVRVRTAASTVVSNSGGFSIVSSEMPETRQFAEEIFLERDQPILEGRVILSGLIAAGLVTQGNTISAEVGMKLPISSHILANISFGLSRIHSNAPSLQQMAHDLNNSAPTLFEGSDIRNTLNGRLQYGFSYQF